MAKLQRSSYIRQNRIGKLLLLCGVLVTIVSAMCFAYYADSHSRYKVIGETDSTTGYHIEYTVSARYRMSEVARADWRASGRSYSFNRKPLPQPLTWIYTHILRKPASPLRRNYFGWEQDVIGHYYFNCAVRSGIAVDKQGYPQLSGSRKMMFKTVEKHMFLSGHPATWYAFGIPAPGVPRLQFYMLLLKHEEQPTIYVFSAIDDAARPSGVVSEMMKIRESIWITKVK